MGVDGSGCAGTECHPFSLPLSPRPLSQSPTATLVCMVQGAEFTTHASPLCLYLSLSLSPCPGRVWGLGSLLRSLSQKDARRPQVPPLLSLCTRCCPSNFSTLLWPHCSSQITIRFKGTFIHLGLRRDFHSPCVGLLCLHDVAYRMVRYCIPYQLISLGMGY